MKHFFKNSLLSTIDIVLSTLGVLRCQLYSLNLSEKKEIILDPKTDQLMTASDVASYLGFSLRKIRRLRERGIIPFVKVDRTCYCKFEDLKKSIELNPAIFSKLKKTGSLTPAKPFFSKSISIAPFFKNWGIITLRYISWRCFIIVEKNNLNNQSFIDEICNNILTTQHQIKPFLMPPVSA